MPADRTDGDWRPALARSIVLRHDTVRGADLLLMPERAVRLSETGGRVLRLCDGSRTVGDIVAELGEAFPGAPLDDDVPEFLDRVRAEGWLR
ncbi:pyrroloquinoline quinone biosynthesis peptide chaperone PqqD [Actinomadura darangshiensis]|uniref:Pyrroloquinoline quinone biosynthesis peptide chaperone PqqD n=1 Tax=Actinomadura darangshiensis TaxID=705336 RepID=A0A4R5BKC1_9ACTN|nr:pyrroloquinoline quinone biosynthesis peptide chaperone PqqD [Actinomadura darangshiensis]TDD84294.1 pyrroloquinoline quinone biosynthesis peptide chaperone PqqD [Actinomadura darangshiensis]